MNFFRRKAQVQPAPDREPQDPSHAGKSGASDGAARPDGGASGGATDAPTGGAKDGVVRAVSGDWMGRPDLRGEELVHIHVPGTLGLLARPNASLAEIWEARPDLLGSGRRYFLTTRLRGETGGRGESLARASAKVEVLFHGGDRLRAGLRYRAHCWLGPEASGAGKGPVGRGGEREGGEQQSMSSHLAFASLSFARVTAGQQAKEVPGGTTLQQLWRRHPTLCDGHRYFLVTHTHTAAAAAAAAAAGSAATGAAAVAAAAADDADVLFRPQDVLQAGACYRAEPVRGPLASMLAPPLQSDPLQATAAPTTSATFPPTAPPTAPPTRATIELPDGTVREIEAGLTLREVHRKLSDYCGRLAKLVLLPGSDGGWSEGAAAAAGAGAAVAGDGDGAAAGGSTPASSYDNSTSKCTSSSTGTSTSTSSSALLFGNDPQVLLLPNDTVKAGRHYKAQIFYPQRTPDSSPLQHLPSFASPSFNALSPHGSSPPPSMKLDPLFAAAAAAGKQWQAELPVLTLQAPSFPPRSLHHLRGKGPPRSLCLPVTWGGLG
ncbi:hypothetical protein CLOM_g12969 [Closterium sp. NIES-68]|nr:hypothetical protein CLOM_g12969 [Closterium sp. NIES-68]GJP61168.1 hypothetical protein CLOP_g18360 [Closterium sp. NIES-67]